MSLISYTKSITNDFPNAKINLSSLQEDIRSSSITVALSHLETDGDDVLFWFRSELSGDEQTVLDGVVANHNGSKTVSIAKVRIAEEYTETGGHFATRTLSISANANSSASAYMWWPYPVSCLAMGFNSDASQKDDTVSLQVGKNTIIGALTSNTASVSAWTSQNYTVGNVVSVTNATHGTRIYTCIQTTTNNETTSNLNYWRRGYPLSVTASVLTYVAIGKDIRLNNLSVQNEVGEVISIDTVNNKIYVTVAPSNSFLASSPTYVDMTTSILKNYHLGKPGPHQIGDSKIGGAYIPAEVLITITYTNNSENSNAIYGRVEYLY